MTNSDKFIKQLEVYFDLELTHYDKGRVLSYLHEYVDGIPEQPPKVINTRTVVYRTIKPVKEIDATKVKLNVDPYDIINLVSEVSGVSNRLLLGKERYSHVVLARHISMYLIKENCYITLKDIGKYFNRDHTTVIHGINHISDILETTPDRVGYIINHVTDNLKTQNEKTA